MPAGVSTKELEKTFRVVANDIRLDILWALWDMYTDDPTPDPEPVPFSILRERVGIRDSGQFHYHLDELVPRFVTHHETGYTLTYAGARIIGAAVSGAYTDTEITLEKTTIDACPNPGCEGELDLGYDQGHVHVSCDTCQDERLMSAPPILVAAHDVTQLPERLGSFTMAQLQNTVRGFCHLCSGPVEGGIANPDRETGESVKVVYVCQECEAPTYTAATTAILCHPAVVSLLHDAGIDYRDIPPWGIIHALDSTESVRSKDPVRLEIVVSIEDRELEVVLDEELSVVEYAEQ